ncbi:MAG: glycogen-binding domain-containing protein [bacterium]|jgi:1,4-alpha-glucan branching enzyme
MKKSTGSKGKKVDFQVTAEPGSEVFVAGTFNNWDPKMHRMKDSPGSGHCKATLVLPPGRHEYKFVVNSEWRADSNCAESVLNDQGSLNSVITI